MSSNAAFNVTFNWNSTSNVSCAATGVPQPTIVGSSPFFNATTNMYMFPTFTSSDAGLYTCVASNTVGSNTITYIVGENLAFGT